ncbi:MAG TPA: aminotransferase class I/II-fold pyridoxal phosphate-dependent enzyme [Pyrinomonadaceae bacterium]|nr:aminotransferase class I/II-fold pyridoxal phosphate-dependent enzyme [Pyrinomonadaceae bacterium]
MKKSLADLAVFGGLPAFAEKLHVGRPNVGRREALFARMNDLLDRRWLTNNGPFVQEFERRVADFVGVKHCVAMCNATIALEIAVRALGLTGEVIVPSFTFVATAHALQWQEITPVFCDVDPETHTLDPRQVERMITPRTTAVIAVHLWGRLCDTEALAEVCRRRNLRLLYDAAHAFGSSRGGRMAGGFGDAEVFSFHATKFFNTFEGGAVTTDDDDLAARMRLMKNFGFAGYDNVIYIGTNGKMTEVSAAMGLTSFESLDEFVAVNRRNYDFYRKGTAGIPGVRMTLYDERERNNYQYVVLEVDEEAAGVSRDELVQILWAENVVARRYFYPGCHRMEPYRSYYPHAGLLLPETEALCRRVLLLPTGTAVGEAEIAEICRVIRLSVGGSREVRERLAAEAEPQAAGA